MFGGLLGMQCPLSYSTISICQVDPFRCPADIPEGVRVHRMSFVVISPAKVGVRSAIVATQDGRDERGQGGRGDLEGCTLKLAGALLTPVGGQQGPDRWQARAAGDFNHSLNVKHQQSMWRLGLHALPTFAQDRLVFPSHPAYR